MERHVDFRQLAAQLIPFFVTRQVFAGSGKIKPKHRGYYAISQRAEHIREEISIGTTTARGIINTRDEPHADREKYRRLHVIVGGFQYVRIFDIFESRDDRHYPADD